MIKVLVVDDSAFSRKVIARILETIPEVRVVDTATDGQDALKKTLRLRPDLITLDLEMPVMNGFTFLRWLMQNIPTPVIVVSSQEADENVFRALDHGAVDFVIKPVRHASMELQEIQTDLVEKVLATPLLKNKNRMKDRAVSREKVSPKLGTSLPLQTPNVIAITSSTGGPPAIQTVLQALPLEFGIPILIAQHMPAGFTSLFAERLNKMTNLTVEEARDGETIRPGHVYISPGGKHLTIEKRGHRFAARVHARSTFQTRYSPSGNVLFESCAAEAEARCIAAVLTGMGDDGKEGMIRVKAKGGITIAESEETAIIFGMPQEAIKAGVVDYVLPLQEIPLALSSLTIKGW